MCSIMEYTMFNSILWGTSHLPKKALGEGLMSAVVNLDLAMHPRPTDDCHFMQFFYLSQIHMLYVKFLHIILQALKAYETY